MAHGAKNRWVIFKIDGPTADYTVKPVLSGHSKKKTNYRLMQVKSIAECSKVRFYCIDNLHVLSVLWNS